MKQDVARRTPAVIWPAVILSSFLIANVSCIRRTLRQVAISQPQQTSLVSPARSATRININLATANELETLPGIGKSLAERIVDHRQKYGPFRRPEELIMIRGITDKKFRALRELVAVE